MRIEPYVTEWGFPALAWYDRLNSTDMPRKLSINLDGENVVTLYQGKTGLVGRWHDWDGLSVSSTPGNSTLSASFIDGRVIPIAISAVLRSEMEELQRTIHHRFLLARANYKAPADGVCWTPHFTGTHVPLEPGEQSPTRIDLPEAECRSIMVTNEAPVPSIHWREPLRSKGQLGSVRHHMVARNLFVGRGVRPGMRHLCFNSYKPGCEGVVEVNADLAFLKGFRVADSRQTNAEALQPLHDAMPGLCVVADFRYGLTLPLTCVWPRDDSLGLDVQLLHELFERVFLPLVGKTPTDEQLGFPARGRAPTSTRLA